MKSVMQRSMLEATRVLREKGPAAATAVIQRGLQGSSHLETSPAAERSAVAPAGVFVAGSFANGAGAREYKLYLPRAGHGEPLPLVVMLHGCTQDPDDFAAGTRMNAAAELEPCFVLYPAQARRANGARCWNWFQPGDQQRGRGEPSILADMTREILGAYPIDPRRVYVAGLSAGGAMAVVMRETYPDLYAAAGVHSGLAYGVAHDVPSALQAMKGGKRAAIGAGRAVTPVMVFHGDRDTTVHPQNGDDVLAQALAGAGASPSTARIEVQPGRVADGHTFTRKVVRDQKGRLLAEHWVVHGAGHAWSGGSRAGSHVDPAGPDATREMLRFFARCAQPV